MRCDLLREWYTHGVRDDEFMCEGQVVAKKNVMKCM